jgi:RHS repeat-associated protein
MKSKQRSTIVHSFVDALILTRYLNKRTNNALVQTFNVNNLNELATASRSGTVTASGTTSSGATSVTVNGTTASLYGDKTFAAQGLSLVDGNNTFTAIGQDSLGRKDTNAVTVWLPASASFQYDLNGNLLSDGRRGFDYDDENQLVRVTVANAWKTEFAYDGKMRLRVRKEYAWLSGAFTQTNEVRYVYDGMLVIQERNGNNLPVATYTRGQDLSGSRQGAGGIGGLLARTDNGLWNGSGTDGAHTYYSADGNGNVTCLLNSKQIVVGRYLYDPYGNTLSMSGPMATVNPYRFSSKEYMGNAGLYYYGYRFYEPSLQRWLNRDPIGESGYTTMIARTGGPRLGILRAFAEQLEGPNLYCFVVNNSLSSVDLFGLTDFNCQQSLQQLAQAYNEAIQGPIQGLENIYNNSSGAGKYDYGYTKQAADTWCINGRKLNADQMANFMLGFQAQAYDNTYPVGNAALNVGGLAGIYYHVTGQSKVKNDPWDNTGFPDINSGAYFANTWPSIVNSPTSQCCKSCK